MLKLLPFAIFCRKSREIFGRRGLPSRFSPSAFSSPFSSPRLALSLSSNMAKSKYDYVRQFELDDRCLLNVWMVVRIDGNNFHEFSKRHDFSKPNDLRALGLMNASARAVLNDFASIFFAYGQSDEYSFVFRKDTTNCSRRASKLLSLVVSLFTSNYVFQWSKFFPGQELLYPPSFDSRIVLYPSEKNLRDYLSWRQVDCHINNLYNTTFWSLVLKGEMNNQEAMERLKGTLSGDKNEILFSQFGINYNDLPQVFRKGTILFKRKEAPKTTTSAMTEATTTTSAMTEGTTTNLATAESEELSSNSPPDCDKSDSTPDCAPPLPLDMHRNNCSKSKKKQKLDKIVYEVVEENCDIISDPFWESTCRLSDFGCSERPYPNRNIPIDRMEDFSKW